MRSNLMQKSVAIAALFLVFNPVAIGRDFVVPVTIDNLIRIPADLFDLQRKTVRFTPSSDGSYLVQTLDVCQPISCDQRLEDQAAQGPWYAKGWSVPLPFAFPFAGKSWKHIYVNMDGNISFDKP